MNKALKLGLFSIAFVVFLTAFTPLPAQGQRNPIGEVLHRMDALNKVLASLKADVRMEKVDSSLDTKDTYMGTTSYIPKTTRRPMYARLDWKSPAEEWLAIRGDIYELYRPRLKQYIKGSVSSVKSGSKVPASALAFMSMSRKQLVDTYYVNYIREENVGGTSTWHIELVPKNKADFKSADLWVDSTGMPIQSRMIAANNDTTTFLLSNIEKNAKLDMSVFSLKIPDGAIVIRG
jgi:outer membrane lipoprotein-sorting protein